MLRKSFNECVFFALLVPFIASVGSLAVGQQFERWATEKSGEDYILDRAFLSSHCKQLVSNDRFGLRPKTSTSGKECEN